MTVRIDFGKNTLKRLDFMNFFIFLKIKVFAVTRVIFDELN